MNSEVMEEIIDEIVAASSDTERIVIKIALLETYQRGYDAALIDAKELMHD